MSGYGMLAITANTWINERAQEILTHGLPPIPAMPGEMRRFDPTEARDEHGRWSLVGAVLKLAAGTLRLEHHGDSGDVTLHDEHGGSIRLARRDLKHGKYNRNIGAMGGRGDFREFTNSPIDMEHVGAQETLRRHETRDGKPFTTLHAGLHKTHVEPNSAGYDAHGLEPYQRDRHTLHLPIGGRSESYDELFARPGTPITTAELESLSDTIQSFSRAQDQLELGHGKVTMTTVGGVTTIDPHHRNQRPIELSRGEIKKALAALDAARFAWDDDEGDPLLQPGQHFRRVIATKGGDITISRLGPDGDFFFESDHNDVRITPDKIDDFLQHLEFVIDVNGDLKRLVKVQPAMRRVSS